MLPRAIQQRPDIIHCHDTLALPLGAIVKLLTGAKLVYDAHELESERSGITKLEGWLTLRVEKLLWCLIDALIVVSPSIHTWYLEKIGTKRSIVILNSPLFSNETYQETDYLRKKFSIPLNKKIFIYIGLLVPGRGIDLVIQAFTHSEISSHIVFLGHGKLSDELKQLASKYSNIHVHDSVPHSKVVPIAQSADFGLCLPQNVSLNNYYCLPNKFFDYCFAGIPVLTPDFPDLRAIVSEYGIGECCGSEPSDIRHAIQHLESSDKHYRFSDLTPLSWQSQELKLLDLYQQIVSELNYQHIKKGVPG